MAIGGGGFVRERGVSELDRHFVGLTNTRRPRVCLLATASGEPVERLEKFYKAFAKLGCRTSHLAFFRTPMRRALPLAKIEKGLLAQDAIYVGGGNTRSMLGVWREWGVDRILRRAWESGIVLGGVSAGAICWFEHGATDSVLGPGRSTPLACLGFLPGSCTPHFDGEPRRRPDFRRLVAERKLPPGIGIDDGAAAVFEGRRLVEAVSSRPHATVHRAQRNGASVRFEPHHARRLGS
jgi:peptidase E